MLKTIKLKSTRRKQIKAYGSMIWYYIFLHLIIPTIFLIFSFSIFKALKKEVEKNNLPMLEIICAFKCSKTKRSVSWFFLSKLSLFLICFNHWAVFMDLVDAIDNQNFLATLVRWTAAEFQWWFTRLSHLILLYF